MTNLQRIACWILALVAWHPPGVCSADDAVFAEVVRPVFQQSCVKCHGRDGKVKGKVDLLEIGGTADLVSDLERLETIIDVLDEHEMPPEKEPELKPGVREQLVLELRKLLHAGARAEKG